MRYYAYCDVWYKCSHTECVDEIKEFKFYSFREEKYEANSCGAVTIFYHGKRTLYYLHKFEVMMRLALNEK